MIKRLKQLLKKKDGAVAAEFALSAPILIALVLGGIELMFALFLNILIEGGLREASRYGIVGGGTQSERIAQILEILEDHTHGFVNFENATVSTRVYPDFNSIGTPEYYEDTNPANGQYDAGEIFDDVNGNGQWDDDMGIQGVGEGNDVVLYTVDYEWPMLTGYLANLVGSSINLSAALAVRNEPF